jgi:hypothetical protein
MEKCTYCIQRVNAARQEVKVRDLWTSDDQVGPIPDGFFQSACQQACPTESIVFGDILDPESKVAASRERRSQLPAARVPQHAAADELPDAGSQPEQPSPLRSIPRTRCTGTAARAATGTTITADHGDHDGEAHGATGFVDPLKRFMRRRVRDVVAGPELTVELNTVRASSPGAGRGVRRTGLKGSGGEGRYERDASRSDHGRAARGAPRRRGRPGRDVDAGLGDGSAHRGPRGRAPLVLGNRSFGDVTDIVCGYAENPAPLWWWLAF